MTSWNVIGSDSDHQIKQNQTVFKATLQFFTIPIENSTTKITVGHMQSESLESTMKGELNVVETVVGLFAFGND